MLSPVTVTTQKSKAQQWSRHAASFHTYFNNKNGYHTHFWGENNNIFGKRNEKLTNNLAWQLWNNLFKPFKSCFLSSHILLSVCFDLRVTLWFTVWLTEHFTQNDILVKELLGNVRVFPYTPVWIMPREERKRGAWRGWCWTESGAASSKGTAFGGQVNIPDHGFISSKSAIFINKLDRFHPLPQ